jgi:hypothetical protein
MSIRKEWITIAYNLCYPILNALAIEQLKEQFVDKRPTAHLEAFCRILVGIAPWIENDIDKEAKQLGKLALKCISSITNPKSLDYIDFSIHEQVLVEAALLCQAFIRGYSTLWCPLPVSVKMQVLTSLKKTRIFRAHDNNWELFPSMIETFLLKVQEEVETTRLWNGLLKYKKWYRGDGIYSDGEEVHMDYYNSYIIHPMITDILSIVNNKSSEWNAFEQLQNKRLQRFAILQERMIAPNGTFPPIGRSLTYRCAAFHSLALCVYKDNLDPSLKHGQVRVALNKVIKATLQQPDTFENGWLTIGLYTKNVRLAEPYINHGSLYICSTVFLPLGLPLNSKFWMDEDRLTTWESLLNGDEVNRDIPYVECHRKYGKCV